jgi:hypothetical protein
MCVDQINEGILEIINTCYKSLSLTKQTTKPNKTCQFDTFCQKVTHSRCVDQINEGILEIINTCYKSLSLTKQTTNPKKTCQFDTFCQKGRSIVAYEKSSPPP